MAFHLFPTLALELRNMIWKEAIPPRRFVHVEDTAMVHHRFLGVKVEDHVIPRVSGDYIYSTSPIPALLHTCSEARQIMIDAGYALAFGRPVEDDGCVWFNSEKDVLYIPQVTREIDYVPSAGHPHFFNSHKHRFESTRHIAVQEWVHATREILWITEMFPKVKELFIIIEHCGKISYVWHQQRPLKNFHPSSFKAEIAADRWTFVDSHAAEIVSVGSRKGDKIWCYPGSDKGLCYNEFFGEVVENIENCLREELEDRPEFSVPRIQLGVMVTESKAEGMLALARERRRKERMLALVRMFLSKMRYSRGYSSFGYNIKEGSFLSEGADIN